MNVSINVSYPNIEIRYLNKVVKGDKSKTFFSRADTFYFIEPTGLASYNNYFRHGLHVSVNIYYSTVLIINYHCPNNQLLPYQPGA